VSEHPDTKSVVDLTSSSDLHETVIAVKWRPFGKSSNRLVMDWIPLIITPNWRDPVSLGEVEGVLHPSSLRPGPTDSKARSSRRGKEQTRPKTSEFGKPPTARRSDLRAGEKPRNETRDSPSPYTPAVTSKHTTRQKVEIVSTCAAPIRLGYRTDRVCVWRAGEFVGSGKGFPPRCDAAT